MWLSEEGIAFATRRTEKKLAKSGQIGYTETSAPVVVVPKGSYEFSGGEYSVEPTQFPKVGDLITLTLDGVVYSETGKYAFENNNPYVYIGNGATLGEPDTGENYFVIFIEKYGNAGVALLDEAANGINATHTVELSFAAPPVTTPISDKYLPEGFGGGGGGLTVVELETVLADGTNQLSEADIEKLSAAMGAKMPVVICFDFNELRISAVFSYFVADGSECFYATLQNWEFMLTNMAGSWIAVVQETS